MSEEFGIAPEIQDQIEALKKRFRGKSDKLDSNMKVTLNNCAMIVERYAKKNMTPNGPSAPGEFPAVDTGRLRASITHRFEEGTGGEPPAAYVGTSVEYAADLEFGTSRMAARPFMRPSLEANRKNIVDRIAKATQAAMQEKDSDDEGAE